MYMHALAVHDDRMTVGKCTLFLASIVKFELAIGYE